MLTDSQNRIVELKGQCNEQVNLNFADVLRRPEQFLAGRHLKGGAWARILT